MNSHVLLHLLERRQTNELLLLPHFHVTGRLLPHFSLAVSFKRAICLYGRKCNGACLLHESKYHLFILFFWRLFFFFVVLFQRSASKAATCYMAPALSQGNASKISLTNCLFHRQRCDSSDIISSGSSFRWICLNCFSRETFSCCFVLLGHCNIVHAVPFLLTWSVCIRRCFLEQLNMQLQWCYTYSRLDQ